MCAGEQVNRGEQMPFSICSPCKALPPLNLYVLVNRLTVEMGIKPYKGLASKLPNYYYNLYKGLKNGTLSVHLFTHVCKCIVCFYLHGEQMNADFFIWGQK